ncbi:hypothetical protein DMUE_2466 [Dictyocoela muelleri]|nr:hypothetical protein DMUE_2466 [Dictyocoela muelleri]
MYNSLSQKINANSVKSLIKELCEYCEKCQKEKDVYFKKIKIDFIKSIPGLYECISIDIKGPIKYRHFKNSVNKQFFYILVITEFISRYSEITILDDINSKTVCEAIRKNWFDLYGHSKMCITDNGRQFCTKNHSPC